VAASAFRLKLRLGHVDADLIPESATVADWIEAALDREIEFKATAGLHRAVRHDPEGGGAHGFLNVLAATRLLLDGASTDDAERLLEERDGATLAAVELGSIRTWFTSFGSCSVTEPLDDLLALGLLEKP
jgi:L-ascorbate metabolism protein UlaG (beta-lactamase superfamily)